MLFILFSFVLAQDPVENSQNQSKTLTPILVESSTEELSSGLQNTSSAKTSSEESFFEMPNVNVAGGTNRSRYLQIRGLGETSIYETTPSHSVGLFIDDIDVTGLLANWQQQNKKSLQVQAGPQSVVYGGFTSAGAFHTKLNETESTDVQLVTSSAKEFQVGLQTHPLKHSDFFLAHRRSEGFFENTFTGRPGTQQNEVSSSWKQKWKTSVSTKIRSSHLFQNNKNFYDLWSLNNSYVTQSDRQGEDSLLLHGHSLNIEHQITDNVSLTSLSSFTQGRSVYSYDSDWGHSASYDYFDWQTRTRQLWHQKVFLHTPLVTVGAHFYGINEKSDIKNYKAGLIKNSLLSDFSNTNTALILQKQWNFAQNEIHAQGRQEWQHLKYKDSNQIQQTQSPEAQAFSFHWLRPLNENAQWSLRWSQGFKNSGFNTDPETAIDELYYGLETTRSYELVLNSKNQRLALFYQTQHDAHLKISQQTDPNDPSTFFYYTTNNGKTHGWGLEYSARWDYRHWNFESQVGLLKTQFRDYQFENTNYRGRDLAHAPRWTATASVKYDWSAKWASVVSASGRDAFYYSNNHQQKSSPTVLTNVGILYLQKRWDVAFWIKNITNTRSTVRGFYFANEPPDWPTKLYEQLGPPRQFLLTTNYRF